MAPAGRYAPMKSVGSAKAFADRYDNSAAVSVHHNRILAGPGCRVAGAWVVGREVGRH